MAHAFRAMAHPVSVGAVAVLLVNDHYLKGAHPGWITGKVSDFAGLVFFPLLVAVAMTLVIRSRHVITAAIALTAASFSVIKTVPIAADATEQAMASMIGLRSQIVVDPTDLIALPAVAVAWWIWARGVPDGTARSVLDPRLVVAVASVATMATSGSDPPQVESLIEDDRLYASVVGSEDASFYVATDGGRQWMGSDRFAYGHSRAGSGTPMACVAGGTNQCITTHPVTLYEESVDGGISWSSEATVPAPGVYAGESFLRLHSNACTDSLCIRKVDRHWEVSTDGGATWREGDQLGDMEADTVPDGRCVSGHPTRCFRVSAQPSKPAYTLDGGITWAVLALSEGVPFSLETVGTAAHDNFLDASCLADGKTCFRTMVSAESYASVLEETTDGGTTWTPSWHASPRYGPRAAPCPSKLAIEPDSGNLVVSAGAAGVIVRDSEANWTQHAVGEASFASLPPVFPPESAFTLIVWGMWAFIIVLAGIQVRAFSVPPDQDSSPRTQVLLLGAMALATGAVALALAATGSYPYHVPVGPVVVRQFITVLVTWLIPMGLIGAVVFAGSRSMSGRRLALTIVATISLIGLAGGFLFIQSQGILGEFVGC